MKDLSKYIKESVDVENIKFKVSSWFRNNEIGRADFEDFCKKCTEQHRIDLESLDNYYNSFNNKKEFVDFINDDVNDTETIDYKDAFMNIIKQYSGV